MIRVDLATDNKDCRRAARRSMPRARPQGVVRQLKPVLGLNVPIMGSPWLMTGLASLLGRSNFAGRAAGGRQCSDLQRPGSADAALHGRRADGALLPGVDPVSRQRAEHHGAKLRRLAGFGLTACRRVLPQEES